MNHETVLQGQMIELQRLLDKSGDDPILAPQLRDRLNEAKEELKSATNDPGKLWPKHTPTLPRAAIFLRGGGVQDSTGIRPSFAGEVLVHYEKMFIEQALDDERVAAREAGRKRRPRGAAVPGLLFTGTPRGSFGLEFVPQFHDDDVLADVHSQSLVKVADAITQIAESDDQSLEKIASQIPARVLQPLKLFLTILAREGAELRLAFQKNSSRSLTVDQVRTAAERLEHDVKVETIKISGTFRGVTLDSGDFNLRTDDGTLIVGTVADQLTDEDLERIEQLTNRRGSAEIQETIVRGVAGSESKRYVLLNASSEEASVHPATQAGPA